MTQIQPLLDDHSCRHWTPGVSHSVFRC